MINNKPIRLKFIFFTIFFIFLRTHTIVSQHSLDRISVLIKDANDTDKSIDMRKEKLSKAYSLSTAIEEDSTKADRLIEIAYRFYKLKDSAKFIKINKEAEELVTQLQSSYLFGYLIALQKLSNLDGKESKEQLKRYFEKYLNRYTEFNTSITSSEGISQNNLPTTELETEAYLIESKRLSQQLIWIIISVFCLLIIGLLLFLRAQKAHNRKLRDEAERQKENCDPVNIVDDNSFQEGERDE